MRWLILVVGTLTLAFPADARTGGKPAPPLSREKVAQAYARWEGEPCARTIDACGDVQFHPDPERIEEVACKSLNATFRCSFTYRSEHEQSRCSATFRQRGDDWELALKKTGTDRRYDMVCRSAREKN